MTYELVFAHFVIFLQIYGEAARLEKPIICGTKNITKQYLARVGNGFIDGSASVFNAGS